MYVNVTEYNFRNDVIRLKMSKSTKDIFYICYGVIYANDFNRHTHTETDKPMAIGEILQMCQKVLTSPVSRHLC